MKKFILLIIACSCFFSVHAAYLKDVPKTLSQPDGTVLHCYASGDEYFNYLHDSNGFTIMQHPQTGFYVYADKRDGQLVATDFVAGTVNPASKGLRPHNLISPQEWTARRNAWHEREMPVVFNRDGQPNHGTLNNISIFIRFADDEEFTNTYSSIDNMFNDITENAISLRNYFRAASYNSIEIPTYFYPGHNGETIISYQDTYPRSYFEPYNAATNPNGYQESERAGREFSLLERAVNYINANYPIPTDLNIDYDNDGYIDNVCFIVRGSVGAWNDLLWPHKWSLYDRNVYINGKRVYTFNFQLADATSYFNTSTMCHEMNHSLSAPDLYHYSYSGPTPVGIWDLMQNNTTPPQHCGAYMKMKYGHWVDEIPEITEAGIYTLNPISSPTPTNIAYKIATDDPNQFYVVEYRDNTSLFETGLPGSGLLVYRIDTRFDGNASYDPSNGIYDEVYIFRPGGSYSEEGYLYSAYFSAESGRTEFSSATSAYPFFTDGTPDNNFRIYNITSAGSTISFTYGTSSDCEPPTNITATVVDESVTLSWDAAVGAVSYSVFRDGSLVGNTTATTFTDTNLFYGLHTYFLKSVDANGLPSTASETVSITIEPEGYVFIGDGGATTNVYLPSYSYFCYTLSQQIYTADEIGSWGSISSISFFNDGAEKTRNYDIYLAHTTKTTFQSTNDWIPVTASDLVFSGDVTMVSGAWTTITLDSPFVYDGESNLALIVDDNTGSWTDAPNMACRVFETGEIQAMRIYGDSPNYDPYNTSSYSGTQYTQKNQILLVLDSSYSVPIVIPDTLAMGYRPNEVWMRPYTFQLYNPGAFTTINSISTDNPYFQLEEVEVPFNLGSQEIREISLTHGSGASEEIGHLIINYGDNQSLEYDLSAVAYDPAVKDVWETAYEVTSFPYTDSLVVADIPLYNNYNLPPTDIEDGADAVYKLVFTEDALLNASMTSGENGKLVLYRGGFEGEGGPMEENYYSGVLNNTTTGSVEVQIGDGTGTTYYCPFNSLWNYSFVEQIYTADEIGTAGTITAISFNMQSTDPQTNLVDVFMKNVSRNNFLSGTDWETVTASNLVFSGTVTFSSGWTTITLDTPFQYDGTSNLMIGMHEYTSGYSTRYFYYTPITGGMISGHSDNANPNPYNMGSYTGNTYVQNNRSNIKLNITRSSGSSFVNGDITVHNGTTTNGYVPVYGFYTDAYNKTEMVFPASELSEMSGMDINSMKFYASNTSVSWGSASFQVFLAEVDDPTISTFYGPGTIVYTGALSIVNHEMEVNFETPYHYNGSNLLVGVYNPITGSYVSCSWYGETVNGASVHGYTYDGLNNVSPTQRNFLPKTTFSYSGIIGPTNTITDMVVSPGTYYLTTSSTSDAWGIEISTDTLSCPEMVFHPTPSDYDTDVKPTAVNLKWLFGSWTTEYMLLLGMDYDNLDTIVDWTRDLTESYVVTGLLNNANYFWQIKERNDGCPEGVEGPVWGFTTLLNGPQNLYATNYNIFEDDDLYLGWTPIADTNILSYNIYQDNEWIGNTTTNNYTVSGLTYNMVYGYHFHVTAVYAGGESNPSDGVTVWVSGNGIVAGHVYEQDGVTGIENATVTFSGNNEFGNFNTFNFTTDANGFYTGNLRAGTYSATATCNGYQASPYNGSVSIVYGETTENIDINLDEVYYPVAEVVADYYPDATDPNSPYVRVHWNNNFANWLYYDDGINTESIGYDANGSFYWGVMFPADSYSGNKVTKVSMYDNVEHTGNIMIFQGGNSAPSSLLYTQAYSCTGSKDFIEWTLDYPVDIDPSLPLWIVMHNNGGEGDYPASCCNNTGDPNGRWVSIDGTTWNDLYNDYSLNNTWMLRAYVTGSLGSSTMLAYPSPINKNMTIGNAPMGGAFTVAPNAIPHYVGIPADANRNSRSFTHYRVYRTDAYNNGPFTEENTVLLADNVTDTLLIDVTWQDAEPGVYKFGVSRVYEGNRESEILWGELQQNNNRPSLSVRAPIYPLEDCSFGPSPDNNVPENTNLPVFRGEYTDCLIAMSGYNFGHFTLNHPANVTSYGIQTDEFTQAACYIDGTYYFANGSGRFGIFDPVSGITTIATDCPFGLIEYNPADGKLYGLSFGENASFYEVNLSDGSYTQIGTTSTSYALTFTITLDGRFIICDAGDECIKEYDPVSGELTPLIYVDWDINYGQDMAMDLETNEVYWAACNATDGTHPLYKVDLVSGTLTLIGYFPDQASAFANATTANHVQAERESAIVWSNPIDKSMYLTDGAVNVTVTLNSGDSPEGVLVQFINLNPTEQALYPGADLTLDATGYYAFESFRRGDYQVQVSFNDYYSITEEVSIWDATALTYMLNEINYAISNLYVSRTGWATWNDEMHGNTVPSLDFTFEPSSFFVDFEGGLPEGWTINDANNDGWTWCLTSAIPSTWTNYSGLSLDWYYSGSDAICSGSYINGPGVLNPDEYLISPAVNIGDASQLNFWVAAADVNYPADHFGVFVSTTGTNPSDFTMLQDWTLTAKGESKAGDGRASRDGRNLRLGNWYNYTVDLNAYAGNTCYIAFRHFNCSDQYIMCLDDIALTSNAKSQKGTKHFQQYQIVCTDSEDNVVFDITTPYCYNQLPTDDLIDGETYHLKVAEIYSSGLSEWQEIDWAYQSCDNFEVVTELNMEINENENVISWTYPVVENRSIMTNTDYAYVANNGGGYYSYGWLGFDIDDPSNNNSLNTSLRLYGGDYCGMDGYVYSTYNNNWYKIDPNTGEIIESDYLGYYFYDCAWDYSEQKMYAVDGSSLYEWNLTDKEVQYIGSMNATFEVVACDINSQLYGIAIGGNLYKINKADASIEYVGSTGLSCNYNWQSGGFDHYTGKLYWYGAGFFAEVDTETGAATTLFSTNSSSHGTFCVPFNGNGYYSPVTGVLGAMVYRDGELLGFTTADMYTDSIATGNHEYAIRVVYNGRNRCPNFNAYYAMSCPLTIGGTIYEVNVTANPAQGGETTGSGSYINGFPCTVTATANDGYVFTNWVMDGEEITNTPEHTFRVRDNIDMVANFIGFTPHWEVIDNPEYTPQSLIGIVNVDGEEITGNYMEVAALCGDECRGRQMLTYYPELNRFLVFMTIYGQEGDDITFDLYNHELGEETEYECLSHLVFNVGTDIGTYDDPYTILFGIVQISAVQTGWNWYSTYVEQEGIEGLEMLETSLGTDGVMIKSQSDGFTINYGGLWMGNLNSISNEQMYMIKSNAPIDAVVSGFTVNANNHPIILYSGWTWIGYPNMEAVDINDALANLNATNGDVLKSKQTFSTYIEGQGWFGTLNTLEPAMGMMYHSKRNNNTTFIYADTLSRNELVPNLTAQNNHWVPNDYEYPDNMSVMAVVELDNMEVAGNNYELAVFEGSKCLGSTELIYVGPANRYMAFLTLSGEENHILSFGLYDAGSGTEYAPATEMLVCTPNDIVGSLDEPFVVHFDKSTGVNQYDTNMTIHPNPANRGSLCSIALSTNKAENVTVEIVNALGEIVSVTSSSQFPTMVKAPNVAGVYMVRVVIDGKESYSRKLIVK